MFTRRAKTYTAISVCKLSVYLQPFRRSSFLECALQPKTAKINKNPYFGNLGFSKSSVLIRLKSSSLVLVVIGSILLPICDRFHERLANNGKITTFAGYRSLMRSCASFLEPRESRLGPLKSTFNAKNFICSLSMSISIGFGAIRSCNVSRNPKSPKNL